MAAGNVAAAGRLDAPGHDRVSARGAAALRATGRTGLPPATRPGQWQHNLFLVAALLCASAASPAQARRGDADAPPARPSAAASERALQASLKTALSRPAPARAPPAAVDVLAFERDAMVTMREREAFIAHLAQQPGGAAPLEQAIRSGKLMGEFDRLLQRYGYSPRNLGDVLAAYLVICWEIVSESDSNDEPAGQRAVRRQLAGPLAAVPAIARMSDAEKQAQAERTAYLTMVAASAYQELKRGGDPGRLTDLQRNVRSSLLRSGIDLKQLVLTEDGLVAR